MSYKIFDEISARAEICEIGRRLWQRSLVAAHDGNISVRLSETSLLCTPSGVSKGFMEPGDLIITDMDGNRLSGSNDPTSELKMHLEIYRTRPDIRAVVHAHPPNATAFAVTGQSIPANVMPEIDMLLGTVPTIPYEQPGSQEFANAVGTAAHDANVFLLSNHGATASGSTLEEAWFRMESLDHCCGILLRAKQAGGWKEIF